MRMMSCLSCVSDTFSSYRVSFSLMTILTMMVLVPGHLVRALFHFPLKSCWSCQFNIVRWLCQFNIFLLVLSVEYFLLVMSVI